MVHRKTIVYRAGRYVTKLLIGKLPPGRIFHNLHHTINVMQGVLRIGRAENLSKEEMEIALIAAWFHDTGHVSTYNGHELVSMEIARKWLTLQEYPEDKILGVMRCIEVTTMPQNPQTTIERVMCDADLYHLSFHTYDHYQELLREEWRTELGIEVTDEEWDTVNEEFLETHEYFTEFGKRELECKKSV